MLKAIQGNRGFPDLFIIESHKGCHGLFLELKTEGTRLYKKSGETVSPHITEQWNYICELRDRDYRADFAIGFDDAMKKIDDYLNEA